MTIHTEDLLNSILESFDRMKFVHAEDVPDIDLYMDQVTKFMGEHLKSSARYPEQDKILTKTMINNYAKNDLLPPPVRKKYSKEHMLLLIFIYYYKGVMSIGDIQTLLSPITEKYFGGQSAYSLEDVYNEVFSFEETQVARIKEDIRREYTESAHAFNGAPEKDRDFLRLFSFICMLSFDVYVKRLLIEKLLDSMRESEEKSERETGEGGKARRRRKKGAQTPPEAHR